MWMWTVQLVQQEDSNIKDAAGWHPHAVVRALLCMLNCNNLERYH